MHWTTRQNQTFESVETMAPSGSAHVAYWRRLAHLVQPAIVMTVGTTLCFHMLVALKGILLARVLGPVARGELGTAVFFANGLAFVGLAGTHLAVARRAARDRGQLDELSAAAIRFGLVAGIFTMVIAMALAVATVPSAKQYLVPLCLVASMALPFRHMQLSLQAVDHGSGQFTRYNLNRLFFAAVFPLMLVVAWSADVTSIGVIVLLSVLQPAIALGVLLLMRGGLPFARPYHPSCQQLLYEGSPYALATLAAAAFTQVDVYAVLLLADVEVQGLYVAAVPIAHLATLVPNALGLFAFRRGARTGAGLRREQLLSVVPALVAMQIVCCVLLMAAVPILVRVLYGEAFGLTATFAAALIPAYALAGLANIADSFLRGRKKAIIGVWSRLISAVGMAVVVATLYPRMEIYSLPWGVLAGHAINLTILVVVLLSCSKTRRAIPEDGAS